MTKTIDQARYDEATNTITALVVAVAVFAGLYQLPSDLAMMILLATIFGGWIIFGLMMAPLLGAWKVLKTPVGYAVRAVYPVFVRVERRLELWLHKRR